MSAPKERDRPGAPISPGARDACSQEWCAEPPRIPDATPGADGTLGAGAMLGAGATPGAGAGQKPDVTQGARSPADGVRRPAAGVRRGGVDPVKTLMHRHRLLCERAVDPLEIAAALEAHGVTDRTAARFRHRDVFSLAEEMYARVPRDTETAPPPESVAPSHVHAHRALIGLLPGALCAAAVTGLRLTEGRPRAAVAAAGLLGLALGVRAVLRHGPLSTAGRAPSRLPAPGARTRTCWLVGYALLGYALLGDGLLAAALGGGPDAPPNGDPTGPWPVATAPVLALALACAPAAWTAHLLAAGARRRLAVSRGLEEFAASVRPLLLATFALFLAALAVLTAVCGAALHQPAGYARTLSLGALLLLARLLALHGSTRAPAAALAVAAGIEAAALATVFSARLPGCGFLAEPVGAVTSAVGPGGVPTLACGAAALALLIPATRTLTRASAHAQGRQ
ncbi:hypothetical protein [Streptomyces sp. NPDC046197]|uniref:hypothetical protein n=1 Tax=Streptomyces sp. NPDC046197 TaxID=3154337 RepID=UPI0033F00690